MDWAGKEKRRANQRKSPLQVNVTAFPGSFRTVDVTLASARKATEKTAFNFCLQTINELPK